MKFINKTALTMALCGLLVSACNEDLLSPVPKDVFSDASVFENASRIEQQINGIYAGMKLGTFYGGRFLVYHDIRGEEFLNETTNGVTGFITWNHTVVSSTNEVNTLWNAVYNTINRVNVFLEGLAANKGVLNNDKLAAEFEAEARFVRGVCYFSLLSLYARPFADGSGNNLGVPLRLIAEKTAAGNDLARSSVAEVYAQILADLDFAEQNLPLNYATPLNNVTRAHRNTAIAYKTRVYLAMQRYSDVIREADKIVSNAPPFQAGTGVAHALQANISAVFASPYTTTESIFSMPFTENNLPGTQNGLGSYYNPGPRGIGDYSLNPAGILGDPSFAEDDARRAFVFLNPANNKPYLNKFPTGPLHLDYAPVIRYSEVLLNLSEAIARTSGVVGRAVDLLNAVRGRSNPDGVYNAGDFANAEELAQALLKERRIELLGEGFRSLDCMRLLIPIPGKANVPAIAPTQSDYIWPIPDGELFNNKLAQPNP
jgi:hypothetical protein